MRRLLLLGAALGLALGALECGEYGTRDYLALRRQVREEQARIASLRHELDSLGREKRLLTTDARTQERIARESFGMIRPGEQLYQVITRDSSR